MSNPQVFFDITVNGQPKGRITFELFKDIVPKTAQNFLDLCTGARGSTFVTGKPSPKSLTYKGSGFHRVIPGFMAQGGDFTNGNGTGGLSIYGEKFADENFKLTHTVPYLLSMANAGPNTNGAQFFITLAPCPWLDGKHVVFGKVVDNGKLVSELEKLGSQSGKPSADIRIADCGQIL